jgi:hypothetical protein
MDMQTAFNFVVGLSAFLGGWILRNLKESIDNLHDADSELTDKVQHIEVLIAGDYVRRSDLGIIVASLFEKLDKIESKLDRKADK